MSECLQIELFSHVTRLSQS